MGEDNMTPARGTFYFCRTEDIGTPEEKWTEMKVVKFSGLSSEPGPETSREVEWKGKMSFNLTATISDRFRSDFKKMWKKEKGRRHYRRKTAPGKRNMKLIRKFFPFYYRKRMRRR